MATKERLAVGPHLPAEYELADVSALQALQQGVANEDQQKRALRWIIERAAGTYEAHFYPEERFTTFALGMGDLVFVALFALFLWRGPR